MLVKVSYHSASKSEYHCQKCHPETYQGVEFEYEKVNRYPEIRTWNSGRHCHCRDDDSKREKVPVCDIHGFFKFRFVHIFLFKCTILCLHHQNLHKYFFKIHAHIHII